MQFKYEKIAPRIYKIEVQNKELLTEIGGTKKELLETQRRLNQPKVSPVATFPVKEATQITQTEITVARSGASVVAHSPERGSPVPAKATGLL